MTETPFYGTQAGIIGATTLIVSVLKRLLGNVRIANAVPTWVYAVAVSGGLTLLAVTVFHTLPGGLGATLWQTVSLAGTSSGFYDWVLKNPTTSLASSAIKAEVLVDPVNLPARDLLSVGPRP